METRIYQCLVTGLFPRPSLPLVLLAAAAALLGVSNPGPNDFADFAGEQFSELGVKEVCREGVLPLMLQLVVQDCPRLFRDRARPWVIWPETCRYARTLACSASTAQRWVARACCCLLYTSDAADE